MFATLPWWGCLTPGRGGPNVEEVVSLVGGGRVGWQSVEWGGILGKHVQKSYSCLISRRLTGLLAILLLVSACASHPESGAERPLAPGDKQWAATAVPSATDEEGAAEDEDWALEDEDWDESEFDEFADEGISDPLETPNRFMFAINEALDTVLFQPAAATYRFILPTPVQDGVRNFFRNLRSPVNFANHLFQENNEGAKNVLYRFMINSTIGVLGLFDTADELGIPHREEDFGQTLAVWGVDDGFYLVLPIVGPSSARDGTGRVVDILLDPLTYILDQDLALARFAIEGIDTRSRNIELIDEMRRDSVDFYARVRSLYRQHRQDLINNTDLVDDGGVTDDAPAPGLSGEESQSSDAGRSL